MPLISTGAQTPLSAEPQFTGAGIRCINRKFAPAGVGGHVQRPPAADLDGQDNDCDGQVDEDVETQCADQVDNDGDGAIDCKDSDCADRPFRP